MEHQRVLNLLNDSGDYTFAIRKQTIVNGESDANYSVGNEIIYSTAVLNSNLCDYSDAQILVRGDITIMGCDLATQVTFENGAPFIHCITKTIEQ